MKPASWMRPAAPLILIFAAGVAAAFADNTDFTDLARPASGAVEADSCQFLTSEEIERVVGERLSTPPFRAVGSRPDENGTDCRYVFPRFHGLGVSVVSKGGDRLFEAVTGVNLVIDRKTQSPGNLNRTLALEGDWDEVRATSDGGLIALQGDIVVQIVVSGLHTSQDGIATLLSQVFRRLQAPLPTNGLAALDSARAWELTRPAPRDPCLLIEPAEVARLTGAATATPKRYKQTCTWSLVVDNVPRAFGYELSWRDGYAEFALLRALLTAKSKTQSLGANAATDPPWDEAFAAPTLLAVVRNDVLLKLSGPSLSPDQRLKLAASLIGHF